jgi:predicted DNA binding CopG/RHH family protein
MIQAPQPKPVEAPKAAQPKVARSEVHSNGHAPKTKQAKGSEKAEEFATELESQINGSETNVKPVEISLEQMMELPSSLVQPNGATETISPKVFDPSLTKGVEKLVGPKTGEVVAQPLTDAQVLELSTANTEVSGELQAQIEQAMLKTPQIDEAGLKATQVDPATLKSLRGEKAAESTLTKVDPELLKSAKVDPELLKSAKVDPELLKSAKVNPEILKAAAMGTAPVVMMKSMNADQSIMKSDAFTNINPIQGRNPALDLAKSEIDPQLMTNEDFVANKNLAVKKNFSNAYGMKAVPNQQQKISLEAGLNETQVVKDLASKEGSSMNSQQFILGLQSNEPKLAQSSETQAPAKVFDMSHIKSSDSNEIMGQITDYVVQAKAAKEPTVNMRVNHEELGMIDITVSKSGLNQESVAINIGTHSVDGKNFFQQNSKDLFSHLTTAGLNISDLKVDTPSQTAKNDFDFGSQSGKNQQGSERQFGSEQNQRRHEQDRRQDLWKLLNQEAA